MIDPDSLLQRAAQLKSAGKAFAVVTVVRSEAPTSAKAGAKALVHADGTIEGWIGGGCAQPAVLASVKQALEDGRPRFIRIQPERDAAPEAGIIDFGMACYSGGVLDIFVDPVTTRPTLLIIGHSPAGQTLCTLGRQLGFAVHIASPGATPDLFPQAERIVTRFDGGVPAAPAFVVVATQGNRDEAGLEAALATGAEYIGFIASQRKAAKLKQYLKERGHEPERVDAIIAPAGVLTGAVTPEEIALSVLTGVVQARRAGRGAVRPVGPAAVAGATAIDAAIDPVCGMSVPIAGAEHRHEYAGRTYYFCCERCRHRFAQQPARFLAAQAS